VNISVVAEGRDEETYTGTQLAKDAPNGVYEVVGRPNHICIVDAVGTLRDVVQFFDGSVILTGPNMKRDPTVFRRVPPGRSFTITVET